MFCRLCLSRHSKQEKLISALPDGSMLLFTHYILINGLMFFHKGGNIFFNISNNGHHDLLLIFHIKRFVSFREGTGMEEEANGTYKITLRCLKDYAIILLYNSTVAEINNNK